MSNNAKINIRENVLLAPMTTFKIGGMARFFIAAENDEQVSDAFAFAKRKGLEVFVLGGGSNVLVSDHGFDGLVLQIGLKGAAFEAAGDETFLIAGAGEEWDPVVAACVRRGLAGFECLSGIPGFVGGTPVQNVGAYGQEVSETIVSVRCYDRRSQAVVDLSNTDCRFSYRRSIFNSIERDRYVVLSVAYKLINGGPPKLAYKDLIEALGGRQASLAETREAVLAIRRSKSMVIDAADPNSRSAGSFFKNPIVDLSTIESIRLSAGTERVPSFPVSDNSAKVPAAWLIEHAGFRKGFRVGNVGISTNHSLALVNFGGGTAAEIIGLKDRIRDSVEGKFKVRLEPEPIFVGF